MHGICPGALGILLNQYYRKELSLAQSSGDILQICATENAWSRVWQALYNANKEIDINGIYKK